MTLPPRTTDTPMPPDRCRHCAARRTRRDRPRSVADLLEGLGLVATSRLAHLRYSFKRRPVRPGIARWWLTTMGLGILAVGLYVAWVRLALDSVSGLLRDDIARLLPHVNPPQPIPAAAHSTSINSTAAAPELADSLVTDEDPVPPDSAAATTLTVAPTRTNVTRWT